MAAAISSVQTPCMKPQKLEYPVKRKFHVEFIAGLIVTIAASLFVLIPINGVALMVLTGSAVGAAGFFFPLYKKDLSNLMQIILINLRV